MTSVRVCISTAEWSEITLNTNIAVAHRGYAFYFAVTNTHNQHPTCSANNTMIDVKTPHVGSGCYITHVPFTTLHKSRLHANLHILQVALYWHVRTLAVT